MGSERWIAACTIICFLVVTTPFRVNAKPEWRRATSKDCAKEARAERADWRKLWKKGFEIEGDVGITVGEASVQWDSHGNVVESWSFDPCGYVSIKHKRSFRPIWMHNDKEVSESEYYAGWGNSELTR